MDPETFLEIANTVSKLKMYPYFEIAHCAVTLLYLREDLASGKFAQFNDRWCECIRRKENPLVQAYHLGETMSSYRQSSEMTTEVCR